MDIGKSVVCGYGITDVIAFRLFLGNKLQKFPCSEFSAVTARFC